MNKNNKGSIDAWISVNVNQSRENPSNEGFRFLKLLEMKQCKSFVIIGRNFKAKMALNE